MYKTLFDIPVKIRDFYHEEIRTEQEVIDGVPQFEVIQVPGFDENGDPTTYPKTVPKMIDVTYIVENSRHDLKTWEDVKNVTIIHKGNKDHVVEHFIKKAIENDSWEFHDKWKEWNNKAELLQEEKDNYVPPTPEEVSNGAYIIDYDELIAAHALKEPTKKDNFDKVKSIKLESTTLKRDRERIKGISFDGYSQNIRKEDTADIDSKLSLINNGAASVQWVFSSEESKMINKDEATRLGEAMSLAIDTLYSKEFQIKEIIKSKTTTEELLEVDIPTLWEQL